MRISNYKGYLAKKEYNEKLKIFFIEFLKNMKNESHKTREASKIFRKYALGKEVSKEEMVMFRKQMIDVMKILGIGIPFVLIPGSTILLPILLKIAKKYKIDILPSSFKKDQ